MLLQIDRLAPRGVARPIRSGSFRPAQVLVDHHQFGVEVVEIADDGVDLSPTQRPRRLVVVIAGAELIAASIMLLTGESTDSFRASARRVMKSWRRRAPSPVPAPRRSSLG
jgi:hypothetical protein